jgi:hypothetical protein
MHSIRHRIRHSIRLLSTSKGTLEESHTSSVIGAVVEMSRVDKDLECPTYGVGTNRVAAEDFRLGCREVRDLAVVGNVRGVPIKSYSNDLVLDSCGQLFNRIVQDGGTLALRVLGGAYENQWTVRLTCIL